MGVETAMVDWVTVLDPQTLGIGDKVQTIVAVEGIDRDDAPVLQVSVVLVAGIDDDQLEWSWLKPIYDAVWQRAAEHIEAGLPRVQFYTLDDWNAAQRGDFYDETWDDEDGDVAA